MPKDLQTMRTKCCLSRGCFPGCSRVTCCGASIPGWTNWFVPSGVRLERGHCYGMHTSPGGRWCHGGTCLLHSQPLSAAQIYLHSLLFSREPYCKRQGIVLCLLVVCQIYMECVTAGSLNIVPFFLILRNDVHYLSTDLRTFASFLFIRAKFLNPATARWAFQPHSNSCRRNTAVFSAH